MSRYYQMDVGDKSADIVIYGDITSWPWLESDVSSYNLSRQLAELDVDDITVRINSYGGEVAEGLAIYNALRASKAKVTTVCDGMACSIASVIFMAGDERVMNEASLLMIHNAWSIAAGDANDLRKEADTLETITKPSKAIYLDATDLSEDELTAWMDDETWIDAATALEHGFATRIEALSGNQKAQTARFAFARALMARKHAEEPPEQAAEQAAQPVESADGAPEPEPETADFPEVSLRIAQAYMDMQTL